MMTELLHYTFLQNALAGSILAGIVCGLIGTYVVCHRMVFIAGGVAHASLGGVGLGALLGFPPMIGATAFSLLTAYGAENLSRRKEIREDSAIAMLWAFGMSIGIICTYLAPRFLPALTGYLFGNILLISHIDLIFLALLTLSTVVVFYLFTPQIVAITFDREFARSQGLPVTLLQNVLTALTALSIVACLRVTGVVMVISLLSVPQMSANLLTRNFSRMALLSIGFSIISCIGGLLISYYCNVPSGATIILLSIAIYMLLRTIKALHRCLYINDAHN